LADITASVDSSIVTDLLGRLTYPFQIDLDGDRIDPGEDRVAESRWGPDAQDATDEDEAFGEGLLDEALQGYLEFRDGASREDPADDEIYRIIEEAVGNPPKPPATVAEVRAILSASRGDFVQKFVAALQTAKRGVEIDWIKIIVVKEPGAELGNPIRIKNLTLKVQARARLCVRLFGKDRCINATTPKVEFQAHEVRVALDKRGEQIWAVPSVKDLDLVIRVRILGIKFTFTIGVTKVTNRFLRSKSTMIFDAQTLAFPLPTFKLAFSIRDITIPSSSTATTIALDGEYTKI
jgi:hypothetical protein